jgi:hypothetical protein
MGMNEGGTLAMNEFITDIIHKAHKIIRNPRLFIYKLKLSRFLPEKTDISWRYFNIFNKKIDFKNPQTFNEKLQWLKLYDRNPLYIKLVDKYEVREYIKITIGEQYLVPLIGVYDNVDEIVLEDLPNQFVLKCTHDSGTVIIWRNKKTFDISAAKKQLKKAQKKNFYFIGREWPYKNIKPRIICEELIKTADGKSPRDYKIFCFNGEPKFAFVASDRGESTKFDFFDIAWNRQPLKQHYPTSNYIIEKPRQWVKMLELAHTLSQGIAHVRVDFYIDSDDQILFGELTFYHFSGVEKFEPEFFDSLLGSWIDLSLVDSNQKEDVTIRKEK